MVCVLLMTEQCFLLTLLYKISRNWIFLNDKIQKQLLINVLNLNSLKRIDTSCRKMFC